MYIYLNNLLGIPYRLYIFEKNRLIMTKYFVTNKYMFLILLVAHPILILKVEPLLIFFLLHICFKHFDIQYKDIK